MSKGSSQDLECLDSAHLEFDFLAELEEELISGTVGEIIDQETNIGDFLFGIESINEIRHYFGRVNFFPFFN